MSKYYAVKRGRSPGIYSSWEECKKQVYKYSGAVFKRFDTYLEAKDFIANGGVNLSEDIAYITDNAVIAYVDGSYNPETGIYGYGAVIFDGDAKYEFMKAFDDPNESVMRNVAGEIEGAMCAMQYCYDLGRDNCVLVLYHDYIGICMWCTGEWRAKNIWTQQYKSYYDKIKDRVTVVFRKVKGHSGNRYNEEADILAKKAVGISKGVKYV